MATKKYFFAILFQLIVIYGVAQNDHGMAAVNVMQEKKIIKLTDNFCCLNSLKYVDTTEQWDNNNYNDLDKRKDRYQKCPKPGSRKYSNGSSKKDRYQKDIQKPDSRKYPNGSSKKGRYKKYPKNLRKS